MRYLFLFLILTICLPAFASYSQECCQEDLHHKPKGVTYQQQIDHICWHLDKVYEDKVNVENILENIIEANRAAVEESGVKCPPDLDNTHIMMYVIKELKKKNETAKR